MLLFNCALTAVPKIQVGVLNGKLETMDTSGIDFGELGSKIKTRNISVYSETSDRWDKDDQLEEVQRQMEPHQKYTVSRTIKQTVH